MDHIPERLLDRPAPEGARWLALILLKDLIDTRQRLDDPDDTKALHDFRVALRRFRSLLRTYREVLDDSVSRKSHRRLSRLAAAAGLSRDCEVRLKWLSAHVESGSANPAGAAWVAGQVDRDRVKGNRRLRHAVDRNFAPLADQLQRTLQRYRTTTTLGELPVVSPMREVTAQALHTLASAVEETLEQAHAAGDPELMHKVRIAAKRLRYALEPLVDRKLVAAKIRPTARAAIAQLTRMQDGLGDLHDELAFDQWLAEGNAGELAETGPEVNFVNRLKRRLHQQATRRYRTLDGPWWRHRINRSIGRAHTVANRLARRKSLCSGRDSNPDGVAPEGF